MLRFARLCLAALLIVTVSWPGTSHGEKIRFGALPVLQALPVYVAQEKHLFREAGIDVEIIPFNAAAEKDIAMSTGSLDGYFGDLVTPTVLKGNGHDVFIVATNYDPRTDRRMIGILAKPAGTYKTISDLADVPVAVSSNSVIDRVTEQLLVSGGVPEDKVATIEAKNIGLRMQMLLSGQVEAATLPEPLVTAAVAAGAKLLADDSGLETSQTILMFSGPFLRKNGDAVKAFLAALNKAATLINTEPDSVRPVMVEHVRLPERLKSSYPVPRFPKLHAPDRTAVLAVAQWLKKRGVITPAFTYEQVVDAGFLP
ncbi:MAG TPA: MetQ/NlpA family ABC transporter substrate-binding protein [Desulfomonilaceae bacterium]|nr:MetQ/NlpA family ABC transporter substrate-binding protein [Desulfomonilaceae bacterium]